jgi:hypothetical protein
MKHLPDYYNSFSSMPYNVGIELTHQTQFLWSANSALACSSTCAYTSDLLRPDANLDDSACTLIS